MLRNKVLILISFVFCFLTNCSGTGALDKGLKETKSFFDKYYLNSELFLHFPNKKDNCKIYSGMFSPPQSDNCYGYAILIVQCEKEDLNLIEGKHYINTGNVKSDKFYVLRKESSYVPKEDILYPIADFSEVDWYMGEVTNFIYNNELKKKFPIPVYNYPKDLKVYLIDAKKGDFWKSKCGSNRFDILGEWVHGYSKGYAISEEKRLLVYWVVAW